MPLSSSASSFFDRLFWRPAIRFLVPLSRSAASYSDRLFWRPAIRFPVPLSRSASPFFDRLFWRPAIRFSFLSPAPPRLILTGYFDARLSGFRCLSPAPQRLLLTGYFTARISGFRCPISRSASSFSDRLFWRPGLPFPVPQGLLFTPRFGILGRLFRRPPFFHHPTFPSRLFGWPARSLCRLTVGLRFLPLRGFYRPAVFTAPRFLPLRGFYRSAFTGSLGGLCSSTALVLAAPQSSPLPGGSLFGPPYGTPGIFTAPRFLPLRGFSRSAIFTAPRFLPLRGFYRSAVFTAPRFLPLRGFYRSAVFTAPRLRGFYRSAFTGSLGGFALPPPSSLLPPRLPPLPGGSLFGPPYGTPAVSAVFTAPRFLPLRDFYRSAVFTAPRFLPLRGFYRSAVFTAPRFLPLRGFYRSAIFSAPLSPVLWGALLFLSAPQSSPSSGRTLCYRLLRSVSGGTPFWSSFCTTCLTALGALPLISPVSLLCISYTLGDHRSSRLLNDGTRAPRVLPPPSWDLSAIGN